MPKLLTGEIEMRSNIEEIAKATGLNKTQIEAVLLKAKSICKNNKNTFEGLSYPETLQAKDVIFDSLIFE